MVTKKQLLWLELMLDTNADEAALVGCIHIMVKCQLAAHPILCKQLLASYLKRAVNELCAQFHRQAPATHARRPFFVKQLREDGLTTIEVLLGTVSKRIGSFAARPGVPHTTLEDIQTAYEAGAKNPGYFLVCAKSAPMISEHGTYAVETYPVGYSHNPAEEQDVQLLAYSVCRALYILWKAKLVHRDVRMANIVRLQGPEDHYMLLDLENVAQVKIWPAVQPFKDWDSFTLSKNSEYDHLSDMYQLGKLLRRLLRRTGSQAAEEFINSIRNKSLTAEQALKHVWLMRQ
ncbi:TPA: hypothetical protein ACH3X1_014330 [Trebouxia sp. C0004]